LGGETLKKIYVLDTNVLLQDPLAIFSFQDNDVVLPAVVLEEVDSKKRLMDEIGRNARHVARLLDELRVKGQLHNGVMMENGGRLRVELNHRSFARMQELFHDMTNDNRILAVAMNLHDEEQQKQHPRPVILVSKDALLRVKADAIGLVAEDFLSDRVVHEFSSLYKGYTIINVPVDIIQKFYSMPLFEIQNFLPGRSFLPNEFLIL
jgi:PhoH-like ATPase